MQRRVVVASVVLLLATSAFAADSVVGTLTVKGKPIPLKHVAVAVQADPETADRSWLVILVSNMPVAEADRTPARLLELSKAGKVAAVRVCWLEGYDTVFSAPYHQALPQSGQRSLEHPTINLDRYDEERYEGWVKSKMLGQDWFFEAHVKADLHRGGVADLEQLPAEEPAGTGGAAKDEKTARKIALARLDYEYSEDNFIRAIQDANVEAVRLFVQIGMSPNTSEPSDRQPLAVAATQCAYQHEAEALEMVKILLAAGAKVDAGARDGITPLLNAAQHCSGVEVVKALLAAGANVNTKAPGGATPLMFANVFNRTEMEAVLRRAGAKD